MGRRPRPENTCTDCGENKALRNGLCSKCITEPEPTYQAELKTSDMSSNSSYKDFVWDTIKEYRARSADCRNRSHALRIEADFFRVIAATLEQRTLEFEGISR